MLKPAQSRDPAPRAQPPKQAGRRRAERFGVDSMALLAFGVKPRLPETSPETATA
jgi:hypothetical protein